MGACHPSPFTFEVASGDHIFEHADNKLINSYINNRLLSDEIKQGLTQVLEDIKQQIYTNEDGTNFKSNTPIATCKGNNWHLRCQSRKAMYALLGNAADIDKKISN